MHRRCLPVFLLLLCALARAEPLHLDLEQAEARLLRNREIIGARHAVESAEAGVTVAAQAPNPTLSWGAVGINARTGIGSGGLTEKRIDQTLGISQLIERGDKRELREAAATAALAATRLELADARRQQRLALHQAYFDVKAAAERLRLLNETAELYEMSLATADKRLKAGDIAPVAVSRLRVEVLRARNDVRTAEAEQVHARRALAWLVGEEGRGDDLVADSPWPAAAAVPPPLAARTLERRPDVLAAQARIEAARHGRELARRQQRRDVTVGASVERNRTGDPPESGVTYGVSVSIPLFLRYDYAGEIAQGEAAYGAALDFRERVLAVAMNEASRAYADYLSAADRLRRAESEGLPEARKVAVASELAYAKGALSLTDLLDARRTLRAIELEVVATRADHVKARAAWLAATEWEMGSAP